MLALGSCISTDGLPAAKKEHILFLYCDFKIPPFDGGAVEIPDNLVSHVVGPLRGSVEGRRRRSGSHGNEDGSGGSKTDCSRNDSKQIRSEV